jgi:probable F420-dependent oxidoreductase
MTLLRSGPLQWGPLALIVGSAAVTPRFWIVVRAFEPEEPATWQPLFEWVRAAERAGFDGLALSGEHVAFGEHLREYARAELGGRAGGEQPTGPDGHFLEPITTLAAFSTMTSRIRFTTLIMLAALRRPLVLAKAVATLDVLSGGRLELGVGVGWQREEYEAAGLEFERRGPLLDQTLEVCQALWRERRASYSSPEVSFSAIHMMPKPVQPGGVPIWVSGTLNPRTMRRLARYGSGWIPWGDALYERGKIIELIPEMREAVSAHDRDPVDVGVVSYLPFVTARNGTYDVGATMGGLGPYLDAGVTDFYGVLPIPSGEAAAEDYLGPWVEAFRRSTA